MGEPEGNTSGVRTVSVFWPEDWGGCASPPPNEDVPPGVGSADPAGTSGGRFEENEAPDGVGLGLISDFVSSDEVHWTKRLATRPYAMTVRMRKDGFVLAVWSGDI